MSVRLASGDAILMKFRHSSPPKNKICLCVCVDSGVFLIISSKAYQWAPADSQIKIFKEDLDSLSHDSFLDVSKYYDDFSEKEIQEGISKGISRLSDSALARIKYQVESQNYLIGKVKKLILNKF